MKEDLLPFLAGVSLLVLYLIFSAMTEMGTRWPVEKVGRDRLMQCEGKPRVKFQAKECRYRILLLCILFHCTFYKFLAESNYCPLLSPT